MKLYVQTHVDESHQLHATPFSTKTKPTQLSHIITAMEPNVPTCKDLEFRGINS
jgi:hypothetical protein